jgi:hypothetical protein
MTKILRIGAWQQAIVTIILIFSGISCTKDEVIELFVDTSLQEYFNRFAEEGALRNVVVDFESSKVNGYIRLITSQGVIGQCAHDDTKPNTVIIDRTYWSTATDLEREFLVFHELGHCVLNREHLDDADAHGDCISIMTSGSSQCRINYTGMTREKLLDELFMK